MKWSTERNPGCRTNGCNPYVLSLLKSPGKWLKSSLTSVMLFAAAAPPLSEAPAPWWSLSLWLKLLLQVIYLITTAWFCHCLSSEMLLDFQSCFTRLITVQTLLSAPYIPRCYPASPPPGTSLKSCLLMNASATRGVLPSAVQISTRRLNGHLSWSQPTWTTPVIWVQYNHEDECIFNSKLKYGLKSLIHAVYKMTSLYELCLQAAAQQRLNRPKK